MPMYACQLWNKYTQMSINGICFSSVSPVRSNQNLLCVPWHLVIFFSCDSYITPTVSNDVCKQNTILYKTSKIPTVKAYYKLVKTNGCQPQAKCHTKTFETLVKTIYMLFCAAEHPHLAFFSLLIQNLMLECLHFFPLPDSYLMMSECSYG